ncbi:MAG: phosphotransferase [Lepagella sp.]
MTDILNIFSSIITERMGATVMSLSALPAAGGDRRYYRIVLDDARQVIGVVADNLADARAFVALSGVFADHRVSVPRVLCHSDDFAYYVEEDLGDRDLLAAIREKDHNLPDLVRASIDNLLRMQLTPLQMWQPHAAYREFSPRLVMWDLNYFKYEFLRPLSLDFDEDRLQDDFETFCYSLCATDHKLWGFMMRDCQSRNIMLHPDPCFIDFQGGRFGPCVYDVVSLLWQARARFSPDFRDAMLMYYAQNFARLRPVDPSEILKCADMFALFRTLQVLGAYGFRGLVQKRAQFVESIPDALENLAYLLDRGVADSFPYFKSVLRKVVECDKFSRPTDGRLHVKVFSFSYKRGYPEDLSGNGGGFMFDCRGMHNPGRYEEYKPLTGRDLSVIQFLKNWGEVDVFVSKAVEMVAPTIDRYMKRGFSSLQIGFGCTGGRHRSVYCAENSARILAQRFPDAIFELIHREQDIRETLNEGENS